jgi:hypothetical protein
MLMLLLMLYVIKSPHCIFAYTHAHPQKKKAYQSPPTTQLQDKNWRAEGCVEHCAEGHDGKGAKMSVAMTPNAIGQILISKAFGTAKKNNTSTNFVRTRQSACERWCFFFLHLSKVQENTKSKIGGKKQDEEK